MYFYQFLDDYWFQKEKRGIKDVKIPKKHRKWDILAAILKKATEPTLDESKW